MSNTKVENYPLSAVLDSFPNTFQQQSVDAPCRGITPYDS